MAKLSVRNFRCWLLAVALSVIPGSAGAVPPSTAELKAVFLLTFGSYVRWPDPALPAADQPFVIGVQGAPEVAAALEHVTRGEKIHGRPVAVRRIASEKEWLECHLIFVAAGAEENVPWPTLAGRPVLTVGETDAFEAAGGMVRFLREGNRLRLRIDRAQTKNAELTVSSRLLRLAEIKGSE